MKTLITLGILVVLGVLLTPRLEFITTPGQPLPGC